MRRATFCTLLVWLFLGLAAQWPLQPRTPSAVAADDKDDAKKDQPKEPEPIEVAGKTQPVPGKRAIIAPTVLHPVEKVLVVAGQRVKAKQKLVQLDADEPEAEVEGKEATLKELQAGLERLKSEPRQEEQDEARACLDNCQICAREARHLFDRLEPLWKKGSIPEQRYHEAKAALAKCEADQRASQMRLQKLVKRPYKQEIAEIEGRVAAAEAALKVARAELEHYTVEAPIDGVVTSLRVSIGSVDRPGTSVWGEILDLSEIDVRCDLPVEQADRLVLGQKVDVLGARDQRYAGKVVLVSLAADPASGLIPVIIRVQDNRERLRCYVSVKVRLTFQ